MEWPKDRRGRLKASSSLNIDTGSAFYELSVALFAGVFAVLDDDAAAGEDGLNLSLDLPAFVGRIIDVHVFILDSEGGLSIWIEDDDVRIGADGDRAFLWE